MEQNQRKGFNYFFSVLKIWNKKTWKCDNQNSTRTGAEKNVKKVFNNFFEMFVLEYSNYFFLFSRFWISKHLKNALPASSWNQISKKMLVLQPKSNSELVCKPLIFISFRSSLLTLFFILFRSCVQNFI